MTEKRKHEHKNLPWTPREMATLTKQIKADAERHRRPVLRKIQGVTFVVPVKAERITWQEARERALASMIRMYPAAAMFVQ